MYLLRGTPYSVPRYCVVWFQNKADMRPAGLGLVTKYKQGSRERFPTRRSRRGVIPIHVMCGVGSRYKSAEDVLRK